MTAPTGTWNINATGYKGTFNITSVTGTHLSGVIDIDPGFTDQLEGHWNEANQEIVFNRFIERQGATVIQTYTGCLFSSHEPLFMGENPPENPPTLRLMTGSFVEVASNSDNAVFGWAARQPIPH
jgi:hypothetical protein